MATLQSPYHVKIEKIVYNGYGLGFLNKLTVFVQGGLPGDFICIRPIKKKRFSWIAEIVEILSPSTLRETALCKHYPRCGGCQLLDISYENQLKIKQAILKDCFSQLNALHLNKTCNTIIASPQHHYHRNKMDFSFGQNEHGVYLGLKKRAQFNTIVPLDMCLLQAVESIDICKKTCDFFNKHQSSAWNFDSHTGLLRYLTIRESKHQKEFMLILTTSKSCRSLVNLYSDFIQASFPSIVSIWLAVQDTVSDTHQGAKLFHISGKRDFIDLLDNKPFVISPSAFFQTNTLGAELLYNLVVKLAKPSRDDVVFDLYCGTGTIGLYIAPFVAKVIGIELNEDSIKDAKKNAELQKVTNAMFFAGDVKDIVKTLQDSPSLVLCDPPRSGLHPKALKQIASLNAQKIVYVSCHPMNMIRDLLALESYGYQTSCIQPLDMFAHSYHMECVVVLEK